MPINLDDLIDACLDWFGRHWPKIRLALMLLIFLCIVYILGAK